MSDDIFHIGPATEPAEVVQPSTEAPQGVADGTGVSAPAADVSQDAAEVTERKQRQERARKNQEAAFRRLASERDEFKTLAMELARKTGQAPAAAPQNQADKAPARENFATWEEYEDARIDWRAEQKVKAHQDRAAKELTAYLEQTQREQERGQLQAEHAQRNAEFAATVPDFAEVTAQEIEIPDAASEAIMSVPNGPAVCYALGKEPALIDQMKRLRPAQQAAFVGQISAALMHRPPQVSKAPRPGVPVGGRGSAETQPTTASSYYDQITKPWRTKR